MFFFCFSDILCWEFKNSPKIPSDIRGQRSGSLSWSLWIWVTCARFCTSNWTTYCRLFAIWPLEIRRSSSRFMNVRNLATICDLASRNSSLVSKSLSRLRSISMEGQNNGNDVLLSYVFSHPIYLRHRVSSWSSRKKFTQQKILN